MKRFFMILTAVCGLMVSTMLTTGCQYDDDDIWSEIENVKGELDKLKTQVGQIQTIVDKLESNKGITSIKETEDGYLIQFTDQSSITIKNGESGSRIGVKEENGVHYWTVDGEFLMVNNQKVSVTGNDGHTPSLSIDNEGYWCVDGNRIMSNDKPVAAQGDSFFQKVEQKGNEVIFTLSDGSSLSVPMTAGAVLSFETETATISKGELVLKYTAEGLSFVAIDEVPAGLKATLDEKAKTVTISLINSGEFIPESRLILKGADKNGYAMLASIPVNVQKADFYVLNEGWFGHEGGTINAYYNGEWSYRAFQAANEGAILGTTSTVGIQNGSKIYIISKDGVQFVEADAISFHQFSSLKLPMGEQGSNFAAISENKGYLTTSEGVYEVALNPISLGKKVYEGNCGDIYNANGKVYFIGDKAVYTFDSATSTIPTKLCEAQTGFACTGNYMWVADSNMNLIKINIKDNTTETIPVNCNVGYNPWAYSPSCLCASNDDKYVFFTSEDDIKQLEVASSNVKTIYSIPEKMEFYGKQLGIDPETNHIYAITTESGWGTHYLTNEIRVINHETGALIKNIDYSGTYWFPSSIIFPN